MLTKLGVIRVLACAVILAGRAGAEPQPVPGIPHPFRQATLSAAVPGVVARIAVREGDAVGEGQVLIELDRRQEELELARRKLLWEDPAEVQAAEARRGTAKVEYEATLQLFEATRSVSREELSRKRLEYDLAVAEHLRAEVNKQREQIEYDMAVEALERRSVRAPMDGVVTDVRIKEGEGCEMRQPLVHLVDARTVEFVANLEAQALARFHEGDEVAMDVGFTPADAVRVAATVSYVSPVVDPASGLGVLKAVFPNDAGRIRPGVPATLLLDGGPGGRP